MVTVTDILTEEDLDAALGRIDEIFDAEPGTPEGAECEALVEMVMRYEDKRYPMGFPTAAAAIERALDDRYMTPHDLIQVIGSDAKVCEVMEGKRDLTVPQARAIHKLLDIRLDILLQKPGAKFDDRDVLGSPLCQP